VIARFCLDRIEARKKKKREGPHSHGTTSPQGGRFRSLPRFSSLGGCFWFLPRQKSIEASNQTKKQDTKGTFPSNLVISIKAI